MRPFDPRLIRHVPALRREVIVLGLLGSGVAAAIVAAASTLAQVLTAAADRRVDMQAVVLFLLAFAARTALSSACAIVGARMAANVKASLRNDLLTAVGRRGPGWLAGQRAGELATLTGRGMDALDGYFVGYLPQLVLSVTVPVAVLAALATADLASAAIVLITIPLIPIFGILIGWQTSSATEHQWRRLRMLGGHFLDMVAGLPTLRAFGRAQAQVEAVRQMADRHRTATMKTLRLAFLSALVLELIGTLAVALVAVPVGLRLLSGSLTLATALLVLLLTPEAFAPLRAAGTKFHASMEGLTALDQAFTLLEPAATQPGATVVSTPCVIELRKVTVAYDRPNVLGPTAALIGDDACQSRHVRETALDEVDLILNPGDRIALVGPSGGGKSTLLQLILGFVSPTSGQILVNGVDLTTVDLDHWRTGLAWVPQRAHLFAATVAENIALGADGGDIEQAARNAALPIALDRMLGEHGQGLSSGERQRLALARAFLRDSPLLLLDEPTARLDVVSEQAVIAATLELVRDKTAVMVAHRPALLEVATRVIEVRDGRLSEMPGSARASRQECSQVRS